MENALKEELVKKYQWAGKIRFLCFFLLFIFILALKASGGCPYFNSAFLALLFIETIINQPYRFLLNRVDIYKFQYYQILTDIIAITWVLYYMGGLDAPVVSIAYYVVILWAGVVSGTGAVIFTVTASSMLFATVISMEHLGFLSHISYYNYRIPTAQMLSLVLGNISFMFAFGYFSAFSSRVIKMLERKKQEEMLRAAYRLSSAGYLVRTMTHEMLNNLAIIKGNAQILLMKENNDENAKDMLGAMCRLSDTSSSLLSKLSNFSREPEAGLKMLEINGVVKGALELTHPLVKNSKMAIKPFYGVDMPYIMGNEEQLQEVFMVIILNAFDAVSERGELIIETIYEERHNVVDVIFSDNGRGIKLGNLKRLGESFFTTKARGQGIGLGLSTAYDIINRHMGKIMVESIETKGTSFIIELPVVKKGQSGTGMVDSGADKYEKK